MNNYLLQYQGRRIGTEEVAKYPSSTFQMTLFLSHLKSSVSNSSIDSRSSNTIFLFMQQNFTINIPTIPSKRILFKIQNNKFKGFDAKEGRFKDNMSYLSSHFVNSFPNLHPAETK